MQSSLWRLLYNFATMRAALNTVKPRYLCTCGNTLYKNASNAEYANRTYDYNLTIEVWTSIYNASRGHQKFIHIDYTKTINTKPVTLQFNKINKNGDGIPGATIKISEGTNVKKISIPDNLTSTADGKIGEVTVTPTANTGTFKINLTEVAPKGYLGIPNDVVLTVSYDNGIVTRNKCRNSN